MVKRFDESFIASLNKPEKAPYFIMKNIYQLKKDTVVKDQNGRKYQVKSNI